MYWSGGISHAPGHAQKGSGSGIPEMTQISEWVLYTHGDIHIKTVLQTCNLHVYKYTTLSLTKQSPSHIYTSMTLPQTI